MAVTNQSNQKVAKLDRIHPMLVGKLTGSKTRNRQKKRFEGVQLPWNFISIGPKILYLKYWYLDKILEHVEHGQPRIKIKCIEEKK